MRKEYLEVKRQAERWIEENFGTLKSFEEHLEERRRQDIAIGLEYANIIVALHVLALYKRILEHAKKHEMLKHIDDMFSEAYVRAVQKIAKMRYSNTLQMVRHAAKCIAFDLIFYSVHKDGNLFPKGVFKEDRAIFEFSDLRASADTEEGEEWSDEQIAADVANRTIDFDELYLQMKMHEVEQILYEALQETYLERKICILQNLLSYIKSGRKRKECCKLKASESKKLYEAFDRAKKIIDNYRDEAR
jgi:hypothetical protein